jgi:hypothetical protein
MAGGPPPRGNPRRTPLQRDLIELGDSVAVALLERAERCFLAWEMNKGERFLEQALIRVQESLERPTPRPATGVARYFAPALPRGRMIGREAGWFKRRAGVTSLENTTRRTEGGTDGKRNKLRGFDCPRVA